MTEPKIIFTGPSARGGHRLVTANLCAQKYSYVYNLGLEPAEPNEYFTLGTLVHVGLAARYARMRNRQRGLDPDEYADPVTAVSVVAARLGPPAMSQLHWALDAVTEYEAHYGDEDFRVEYVEEEFRATVAGHLYTMRFDLVVSRRGRFRVFDHKTQSRFDTETTKAHSVSLQSLAAQAFGAVYWSDKFDGFEINGIGVGRGAAGKSGEARFKRRVPDPAPSALSSVVRMVQDAEARIASCAGRDPWDWPRLGDGFVCARCPYFRLCQWGKVALNDYTQKETNRG